jgi:hypothetical protein
VIFAADPHHSWVNLKKMTVYAVFNAVV